MKLKDSTTLLNAMLPHVPFDGWSETALMRAAEETGLSAHEVACLLPNGAADCLALFMNRLDEAMLAELATQPLAEMKLHERIEAAVMSRLSATSPHREAVRKAMAFYAMPHHADQGILRLYQTVDAIWRGVGDTPTDFSFYTKRLSLALIYSTTLLFWLDDNSDNQSETRAFLQRRMQNLFALHKIKKRLTSPVQSLEKR